jgi:hypothetical protein
MLGAGSAAAALVLLVGIGEAAGVVHVRFSGQDTGQGSGHGTGTSLTAVNGCTQLEQANGTLEQVNGTSLVIKTASGQPVTVTTKASTRVAETGASRALLGDIADGASVTVIGPSSGGTITAFSVVIANPAQQNPQPPSGMVAVRGTVSDASTSGFVVVTSGGDRVPVVTSSDTVVSLSNASLGQLPVGAATFALGYAGPDGKLSAVGVVAILRLPAGEHVGVSSVRDCSRSSIDEALGEIGAAPGDAG